MNLQNGGSAFAATAYSYDGMSRLVSTGSAGVLAPPNGSGSPAITAYYSLISGSSLLNQTSISSGADPVLSVSRSYDNLNRLTSISSLSASVPLPLCAYSYVHNSAGRRTRMTLRNDPTSGQPPPRKNELTCCALLGQAPSFDREGLAE